MRFPRILALIGTLGASAHAVHAQDAAPLPITGSLVYNLLLYDHVDDLNSQGAALRFAGRVAVPVSSNTYVGLGGGSWVRDIRPTCFDISDCRDLLAYQSEAVVYQLYVQQYMSRRKPFLRIGAGAAQTATLSPRSGFIDIQRRWRAALSVGGGIDLRIADFLYLTPSFDATFLPGADAEARELRSGFATGLALTLR